MSESKKIAKILVSPKKDIHIPKESMSKFVIKCLKEGGQDTAIVDAHTGKSLTYTQLLNFSITMADKFTKIGLRKNDVIAIISPNNVNYLVPVFASLYTGAIAQMINANFTLHELTTILNMSQPKCIFCSEKNVNMILKLKEKMNFIKTVVTFESNGIKVLTYEELLQENTDLNSFHPEDVDLEDVAYIFSSSGTTGLPKCVMITHQNAITTAILTRTEEYLDFKKGESLLLPLPFFHIYGFCYLTSAVLSQTKCIIMEKFIPELYLQSIAKHKITKLTCPPPLMKFLAQSSLLDGYDLSSVTDVTYGSAPLQDNSPELVEKRLLAQTRQGYGTTELSGACTFIPKNSSSRPGSCGALIPTLMAKVCNAETSELLGPHEPGELCIKGCITMKGYLGNPEATKESFDKDGFYHTGDLVYYDEEGYIYIVDRLKEIIKYKGFQVSPTELESVLMLHPAVLDAGVVGIPDERAGEVPMAFVILKENFDVSEEAIADYVSEHVNSSKWLYGGVRFVTELPKTSSGKTMRTGLREMASKLA